jgi:hypothetical protein
LRLIFSEKRGTKKAPQWGAFFHTLGAMKTLR